MAYTIKGWDLPIAGHIDNHAAQLTQAHITAMQERLGIAVGHEWDGYDAADPIAVDPADAASAHDVRRAQPHPVHRSLRPETLGIRFPERASTQGAFGHILVALSDIKDVAARLVTTSPDVAVSTNLANWINQRGIYAP